MCICVRVTAKSVGRQGLVWWSHKKKEEKESLSKHKARERGGPRKGREKEKRDDKEGDKGEEEGKNCKVD